MRSIKKDSKGGEVFKFVHFVLKNYRRNILKFERCVQENRHKNMKALVVVW